MPTLNLRNPEFGDSIITDFRQRNSRNLNNRVVTYRNPTWPKIDTFRFIIKGNSKTDLNSILSFLETNRGQEITIVDYMSCVWTGFVVEDPRTEQEGRGCQWTLNLSFEGSFKTP